jgi:hypothetical protein
MIIEYDWKEPNRTFFYRLALNCKKFKYVFTMPKGTELKNRVLKVDPETEYKVLAAPPPKVSYLEDAVLITWEKENLRTYEVYQFDW